MYGSEEDRFNDGPHKLPEGVDTVVSHGRPAFTGLSGHKIDASKGVEHRGCKKLATALERVKPRLCCFGHIHEGCGGAAKLDWGCKHAER